MPHLERPVLTMALIGKLDDCKTVIEYLDDRQYQIIERYQACDHKSHSAVGAHMRHVVEFIQTLLDAQKAEAVDYDMRARDKNIETDRAYALKTIETLQVRLADITEADLTKPLAVHEAVHVEHDIDPQVSSLGRELVFVIAHTEHHFALIGAQCDALGVVLPDNFGKAISTLRHEISLGA